MQITKSNFLLVCKDTGQSWSCWKPPMLPAVLNPDNVVCKCNLLQGQQKEEWQWKTEFYDAWPFLKCHTIDWTFTSYLSQQCCAIQSSSWSAPHMKPQKWFTPANIFRLRIVWQWLKTKALVYAWFSHCMDCWKSQKKKKERPLQFFLPSVALEQEKERKLE